MNREDKTYRTRDGHEVRIYAMDGGLGGTIHGAVNLGSLCKPNWIPMQWTECGMCMGVMNSGHDLIEVRPRHKRTVWLNVYDNEVISLFIVKEKAYSMALEGRIACIKVDLDFEEGEGL